MQKKKNTPNANNTKKSLPISTKTNNKKKKKPFKNLSTFKKIKRAIVPVLWVIIILFLFSVFMIGAGSIFGTRGGGSKTIALKIGKQKVSLNDLQKVTYQNYQEIVQSLKYTVPQKLTNIIGVNKYIDQIIFQMYAKKNGIRATSLDINTQFNIYKQKFPNGQLSKILERNGLGINGLKKQIASNIVLENVMNQIANTYVPATPEIQRFYNANKNFGQLKGKKLTDKGVRQAIMVGLKKTYSSAIIDSWLEKQKATLKIQVLYGLYANTLSQLALKIGDYKFNNIDLSKRIVAALQKVKNNKKALQLVINDLENRIKIAQYAKTKGIKENKLFATEGELDFLINNLVLELKGTINFSNSDLQKFFNTNKAKYSKPELKYFKAIYFNYDTNSKTQAIASAQDLIKKIQSKKITFEEALTENPNSFPKDIGPVYKGIAVLPNFGADPILTNIVLKTNLNQIQLVVDKDRASVIKITKITPPSVPQFKNMQTQISKDYVTQTINKKLKSIVNSSAQKNLKVEFIDQDLNFLKPVKKVIAKKIVVNKIKKAR